jgi:putative NADH-flavin reductase
MHLAIFGGTGPSGICLIEEALNRNHTVSLLVRSPSKLPAHITSSPAVTVIRGSLSDRDKIAQTLENADAVLSALGPSLSVSTALMSLNKTGTPIADGYKLILEEMHKRGITRLIALGTISIRAKEDGSSVVAWGLVTSVWIFVHYGWKEVTTTGDVIRSSEGIDWTIARVAKLTSGKGGNVSAGYIGKDHSGIFVARKDLAKWYLDELEQGKWINQSPVIYSSS